MTLLQQEEIIKEKISNDRSDETIYTDLQRLISMFLRRKRVCNCGKDYEDLSYQIAGDLFMDITRGLDIDRILGYLELKYRSYAHEYYKSNGYDYIPYDDTALKQVITCGESSHYRYRYIDNKVYLEEIIRVVDEILRTCKYKEGTASFVNIKLSLIISILRGEIFSFHLDKEQEFYLPMLIEKFRRRVVVEGLDLNE